MERDDDSAAFAFDSGAARQARGQRFMHFHTVEMPRLRLIGFLLCAIGVVLHNWLVQGHVTVHDSVYITSVLVSYALIAWGTIAVFWRPSARLDIGDAFLVLDVVVLAFIVYVSGANHSFMWIIFIARPADQVATTFKQSLFFAHLGPLAFFGLMAYITAIEHREIDWSVEIAKGASLYIMSMYIALTARTAEARRNKLAEARRIAEQAVRDAAARRLALESANAKLESASKAKSEFLANVSHELRTPLNSVMGSSDLLLDSSLTRDQQEVLDKLAGEHYDLILMDLQMPVMDGLDAARRLRQRESDAGLGRVPIVAMTARAMAEDRERCFAAGMDGYLSKPLDHRALFDVLAQFGAAAPGAPSLDPTSIAPVLSDPALVRHVAGLFLSTAPGQLARLTRALELGDAPQARSVAHSLTGAAQYFAGADTSAAVAIETLCAEGHVERALGLIEQLRADIDALSTRLRVFLQ